MLGFQHYTDPAPWQPTFRQTPSQPRDPLTLCHYFMRCMAMSRVEWLYKTLYTCISFPV